MQENPYAPPLSELKSFSPGSFVTASRWKRLWAALIDTVISTLIMVPLMYFSGVFERMGDAGGMTYLETLLFGGIGLVVFLLLHGWLLKEYGQTIGKRIIGIKITDLDGRLPKITKHLLPRYGFTTIISLIPSVGGVLSIVDILFIFGKQRRCLHDYLAKTIVVYS